MNKPKSLTEDDFNKVIAEKLSYSEALSVLKTYYEKLIDILDYVCNSQTIFLDKNLNAFYVLLNKRVWIILERKDFFDLKQQAPNILDNLYDGIDDFDIEWNEGRMKLNAETFLAKLGEVVRRVRGNTFKFPLSSIKMFKTIDNLIKLHEKDDEQNLEKQVNDTEQAFESITPEIEEKKTIIHYEDIHPLKLPQGTKWGDVTIKFKNGNDVSVSVGQCFFHIFVYKDMGFYDYKGNKPNIQWELLEIFAKKDGQCDISGIRQIFGSTRKKPMSAEAVEQIKCKLSKTLKYFFNIHDDPFYPCGFDGMYRTKFNINNGADKIPKLTPNNDPFSDAGEVAAEMTS